MNEYNHHRIIERVALDRGLDASIKKVFIEASDFTDSIKADSDYFFYRNYYTIEAKNNTIQLNRVKSYRPYFGMGISGEKKSSYFFSLSNWDANIDKKEFFSAVNEGRKSAHLDLLDIGNQSDNVAFLHAMGAEGETIEDSRSIFENHLKTCFAEYLFLENEKDALFVLGIAFHGIMDSFTPSHMNFQKYTEQDMGLHAQGDVIPVLGKFNKDGELKEGNFSEKEKVRFDPGQFTKEGLPSQGLCIYKKRFSGNESHYLNPVEDKMLEIFFFISDIEELKGNVWNAVGNIDNFLKAHTIKQINDIFDNGNYRYSPKSYAYSEAAIRVICDIYKYLSKKREECKNYSEYKNNKQEIVNDALDIWKKVYDKKARMDEDGNIIDEDGNIVFLFDNQKKTYAMKTLREDHILSLYSKDSGLDEKYEKYKESNEYKEWAAQQDIDRLNRLKG